MSPDGTITRAVATCFYVTLMDMSLERSWEAVRGGTVSLVVMHNSLEENSV